MTVRLRDSMTNAQGHIIVLHSQFHAISMAGKNLSLLASRTTIDARICIPRTSISTSYDCLNINVSSYTICLET